MTTVSVVRERPALRRVALFLVIGSFSIAACMGIGALLLGRSFGETETRILLTTLGVGLASLLVLACFSTLDSRFEPVGVTSAAFTLVPLAIALYLIWRPWDSEPSMSVVKLLGCVATIAATLAQVCLLLASAGRRPRLSWLLWATIVTATAMGLIVIGLITEVINGDHLWRLIGTVAILDVLGTIVVIALAVFGKHAPAGAVPATSAPRTQPATGAIAPDLLARLDERAAASGVSRDDLVNEALRRYLDEPRPQA